MTDQDEIEQAYTDEAEKRLVKACAPYSLKAISVLARALKEPAWVPPEDPLVTRLREIAAEEYRADRWAVEAIEIEAGKSDRRPWFRAAIRLAREVQG
ncbi:MAG: hypothetical protein A3E01_09075 [Gammaproteobacteria bacterium RIFCSPHIGHO2_12_FULL_63_22]|nr:MAG: hypothetical protein A3E01_09075 [Gammaproteobacteria bacterium RIFCSPHIGHO2_12_FULL_63_22]